MQNENAGKTVKTLASEKYPINADMVGTISQDVAEYERKAWQDGYTTAQQSQPMWREIESDEIYDGTIFRNAEGNQTYYSAARGLIIMTLGYTHYLSSEDLLRLPTEKK